MLSLLKVFLLKGTSMSKAKKWYKVDYSDAAYKRVVEVDETSDEKMTFREAKKELVEDILGTYQHWKWALKEARALKAKDVESYLPEVK
jgi:hypothetical protein